MTVVTPVPDAPSKALARSPPRHGWAGLVPIGLALVIGSFWLPADWSQFVVAGLGIGLVAAGGATAVTAFAAWITRRRLVRRAAVIGTGDPVPVYATDAGGVTVFANAAAGDQSLENRLAGLVADPARTLRVLAEQAAYQRHASREIRHRQQTVRLTGRAVGGGMIWRLDPLAQGSTEPACVVLRIAPDGACSAAGEHKFGPLDPSALAPGCIIDDQNGHRFAVTAVRRDTYGIRVDLLPLRGTQSPSDFAPDMARTLAALPIPVLKLDASGNVVLANAPARALLELDPDERVPLTQLVEGPGRLLGDWLRDAMSGRGLSKPETVRAVRGGADRHLTISLGRIRESDDRTSLLAILTDATELKTLEAQFVQSQKMQAIGQLAGGVAHDFNNLLTAISGHADLLLLRHDEGDPDHADLRQITQNANRAAALVSQLLAFSRKQTLAPQTVDLRDTLGDLTHLLNRLVGEKVRLDLAPGRDLHPIRADKRQLEQVIVNLVVNARDAMPEGGTIRVETVNHHLDAPQERDRAKIPAGDYVRIRIVDDGVGIPPEVLPKIFEPFYTSKRQGEGTGLGLSTAYGIVKQTGGFIFVDSTRGQGSAFTVLLPKATDISPQKSAEVPRTAPTVGVQGEGVILLVEDEAPVRAFAARALKMRGHTVLEAPDAEEALTLLNDTELDIDVFVTDVIMPGRDGPSWVREALQDHPDTRVIFVSGYAEEGLTDSMAQFPNAVFLPKPFSLRGLTATVNEQLAAARAR